MNGLLLRAGNAEPRRHPLRGCQRQHAARARHRAQDDRAVLTMARTEAVDEAIDAAGRRRPFMAGGPAPARGRG